MSEHAKADFDRETAALRAGLAKVDDYAHDQAHGLRDAIHALGVKVETDLVLTRRTGDRYAAAARSMKPLIQIRLISSASAAGVSVVVSIAAV